MTVRALGAQVLAMRRTGVLAALGIGLAGLCAPQVFPLPVKIVHNPSDRVRRGCYRVEDVADTGALNFGSIELAQLPADAAALAAERGYLPVGIPILKRIGAVFPIGVYRRPRRPRRRAHRRNGASDRRSASSTAGLDAMPSPVKDELFLLTTTNSASFDSRYFGPIVASAVLGVAHLPWTGAPHESMVSVALRGLTSGMRRTCANLAPRWPPGRSQHVIALRPVKFIAGNPSALGRRPSAIVTPLLLAPCRAARRKRLTDRGTEPMRSATTEGKIKGPARGRPDS